MAFCNTPNEILEHMFRQNPQLLTQSMALGPEIYFLSIFN